MAEAWNPWQKVYFPEDKSTGQLQCWEVQDEDSEIIAVCWREADADLILADHAAAARVERLEAALRGLVAVLEDFDSAGRWSSRYYWRQGVQPAIRTAHAALTPTSQPAEAEAE